MKWLLGLLLLPACGSCATRLVEYKGLAPGAIATTFCDADGQIRSGIDAAVFQVQPDGTIAAWASLQEILAHEAVHRAQMESRRPEPGVCPPAVTWPEVVRDEVAAYCISFAVAMQRGANPALVGQVYAGAFRRQFANHLVDVRGYVESQWKALCPGYALVWDAP